MNYLAHLYFSDPNPLAWAGSLMGDFVKGAVPATFPEELSRHLKLHRHIDSLTQHSEIFQTSRRRLDPRFRHGRSVRFARVRVRACVRRDDARRRCGSGQ